MNRGNQVSTIHLSFSSIITLGVVLVMLVQNCVAQQPLDGITVYRALFFTSGPLVQKIPTLNKVAPFLPPEYISLQDRVINEIQHNDPKFLDHFVAEIQSGDHVRVAAAMLEATRVHRDALLAVAKVVDTPFTRKLRQAAVAVTEEPLPEPTEVEGNVSVEIVVLVLIALLLFFPAQPMPTQLKGLSFERYVNEIVKAVPRVQSNPNVVTRPPDHH